MRRPQAADEHLGEVGQPLVGVLLIQLGLG